MAIAIPGKLDRAWMTTTTTLTTSPMVLGSALSGYLSLAAAGAVDGATYRYVIVDGANWEIGTGVYTAAGTTLTRNVEKSSNSNSLISLSGSATVFVNIPAKDLITEQIISLMVLDGATAHTVVTGAGDVFYRIPASLNGMKLARVAAAVKTAGTTGAATIQISRKRSGASVNMLSTAITIDSTTTDSSAAATPAVIDTSNDGVQTGDQISVNITGIQSTPASGLIVELTFHQP